MLPSKITPTSSPFRLTTGLPELPPMMSAVEMKLKCVCRKASLAAGESRNARHRGGRSNGGASPAVAALAKSPPNVVNGAVAALAPPSKPRTVP